MNKRNFKAESFINYSDLVEDAKETAVQLYDGGAPDAIELFYESDLATIENGIKKLNEFSTKCWLISAITLYSIIYDQQLYAQSGLNWEEYLRESRARLGLDPRDVTVQLSSARYFIKYHKELQKEGWTPNGQARKLSYAEYAEELSKDHKAVIKHLCNDTWIDFKDWYTSFKEPKLVSKDPSPSDNKYTVTKNKPKINGIDALTINPDLPEEDRLKLQGYINKIFESLKSGYEPAIIPVYDNTEATTLLRLRDKNRQKK